MLRISTIIFLTFISSSSLFANESDVKIAFFYYRKALLDENGSAAWNEVDYHTQNYYEKSRKDAISMSRRNFDRSTLMHRFMVARLRLEFSRIALEQADAKYLFVYAVENGWISKAQTEKNAVLGRVEIDGHKASAYLPDNPKVPVFHFIREKKGWKLSLTQTFDLANGAFEHMQKKSGLDQNEYILMLLRNVTQFEVDESVFDGPLN